MRRRRRPTSSGKLTLTFASARGAMNFYMIWNALEKAGLFTPLLLSVENNVVELIGDDP